MKDENQNLEPVINDNVEQLDEPTVDKKAERADPVVEIGEKYLPGYFSPKDKVALIWSSAAVILGGAALVALAFMSNPNDNKTAYQHKPFVEIKISADQSNVPLVIKEKSDQVTPVKAFTTEVPGINGWIVEEKDGGPMTQALVYSSSDGKYLLVGGLVGLNDTNLTIEHFSKFADSKVAEAKAAPQVQNPTTNIDNQPLEKKALNFEKVAGLLKGHPSVILGSGDKKLTIVVDLNCSYCHRFYASIVSDPTFLKSHKVTFIPVGILGMDSVRKAAAFEGISNEHGINLLRSIIFGEVTHVDVSEDAVARSMNRAQAWNETGLNVVPMTLVNINNKKEAHGIPGVIPMSRLKSVIQ